MRSRSAVWRSMPLRKRIHCTNSTGAPATLEGPNEISLQWLLSARPLLAALVAWASCLSRKRPSAASSSRNVSQNCYSWGKRCVSQMSNWCRGVRLRGEKEPERLKPKRRRWWARRTRWWGTKKALLDWVWCWSYRLHRNWTAESGGKILATLESAKNLCAYSARTDLAQRTSSTRAPTRGLESPGWWVEHLQPCNSSKQAPSLQTVCLHPRGKGRAFLGSPLCWCQPTRKSPWRIEPFPAYLEARNLLWPSHRSPGLSHQSFDCQRWYFK